MVCMPELTAKAKKKAQTEKTEQDLQSNTLKAQK